MKKFTFILAITMIFFACAENKTAADNEHSEHDTTLTGAAKDTSKKSIPSEAKKWVGNTDIKINYHAPAVRGRTIWGGLVAYDAVWVTGAHKATTFEIGKDFMVGGKTIPAGKYAIFTIPGKELWTIIINKNWNQHLADDYSEGEDVARITAKPQALKELVERLKYEIVQKGERLADITISWEKVAVSFGLEVL